MVSVFFIVLLSAVAIAIFAIPIRTMIQTRREIRDYDKNRANVEPYELTEAGATVYAKRTYGEYAGSSKAPAYTTVYEITFLKEDGSTSACVVTKELYDKLSEGTTGYLVTQNGEFFDFGEAENV